MTAEFYLAARRPDANHYSVDVSPTTADWTFSHLRVLHLEPGAHVTFETGSAEWIVLPLSGSCTVRCAGTTIDVQGRDSVFTRVSDFAYVPRDHEVEVTSATGGRFALTGAECERALPVRYGPATGVPVELRGAGSSSRQCNNFASPDGFETDRLIAVEVIVPGGNWASYPPHKHDVEQPGEAQLEEIYYFEIDGGAAPGVAGPGGYQRVYASDPQRPIDVTVEVSTGDVILIPYGYHGPTMASPGYDLYFLNVLAGPARPRTMSFCDDPAHHWVRESWQGQEVDPRLPVTSSKGIRCA